LGQLGQQKSLDTAHQRLHFRVTLAQCQRRVMARGRFAATRGARSRGAAATVGAIVGLSDTPGAGGQAMPVGRGLIFSLFLIVGMTAANAAPNIPPGEMAGRERERFIPSPVDRFTDPFAWPRQAEPLYRWCDDKAPKRAKRRQGRRDQGC